MTTSTPAPAPVPATTEPKKTSPIRVKTNIRAGGGVRLFDSQNN